MAQTTTAEELGLSFEGKTEKLKKDGKTVFFKFTIGQRGYNAEANVAASIVLGKPLNCVIESSTYDFNGKPTTSKWIRSVGSSTPVIPGHTNTPPSMPRLTPLVTDDLGWAGSQSTPGKPQDALNLKNELIAIKEHLERLINGI